MRYLPGLPAVEGSICNPTYNRAGCRTPMQWDSGLNAGFSTAHPDALYLPIDPDPDRPNVAAQRADVGSVLRLVRRLIELRRATPALRTRSSIEVVHAGYPFAYVRVDTHLVVLNPRRVPAVLTFERARGAQRLLANGTQIVDADVHLDAFAYAILAL
jgi:glycosidase